MFFCFFFLYCFESDQMAPGSICLSGGPRPTYALHPSPCLSFAKSLENWNFSSSHVLSTLFSSWDHIIVQNLTPGLFCLQIRTKSCLHSQEEAVRHHSAVWGGSLALAKVMSVQNSPGKWDWNWHNLMPLHCKYKSVLQSYIFLHPVSGSGFTGRVRIGSSKIRLFPDCLV